jgi:hypothetical protein
MLNTKSISIKGAPMKFIKAIGILIIVVIPIYSQTFPMDRWLDKVELESNELGKSFQFIIEKENVNGFVEVDVVAYCLKSKTLLIDIGIRNWGNKPTFISNLKYVSIDEFPPNEIKLGNIKTIITIFGTSIFVNGQETKPSINEIKNIFLIFAKKSGIAKDAGAIIYKYNCISVKDWKSAKEGGINVNMSEEPIIADSLGDVCQ